VVICLERGADLHMAQLMPLPLTVCCFSKIQIGFTFLVPAHPGSPGKGAVRRVCVCVCVNLIVLFYGIIYTEGVKHFHTLVNNVNVRPITSRARRTFMRRATLITTPRHAADQVYTIGARASECRVWWWCGVV